MTIETYEQAVAFGAARTNYKQIRLPTDPGEFSFGRMRELMDRLGNPERRLKVVHVAGTKGKGSTSAMLESILRQAGYRTGLFTSPDLVSAAERIQVDGQPISQADFVRGIGAIEPAVRAVESESQEALTFFEIITALGFFHFAQEQVDVAIVEVGLGGRLDSTNVCMPLISVITSISFDHMAQLGNTLPAIAREKAGIIKQGRVTVSGIRDRDTAQVIRRVAEERWAPLRTLGADFDYCYRPRPGSRRASGSTLCVRDYAGRGLAGTGAAAHRRTSGRKRGSRGSVHLGSCDLDEHDVVCSCPTNFEGNGNLMDVTLPCLDVLLPLGHQCCAVISVGGRTLHVRNGVTDSRNESSLLLGGKVGRPLGPTCRLNDQRSIQQTRLIWEDILNVSCDSRDLWRGIARPHVVAIKHRSIVESGPKERWIAGTSTSRSRNIRCFAFGLQEVAAVLDNFGFDRPPDA